MGGHVLQIGDGIAPKSFCRFAIEYAEGDAARRRIRFGLRRARAGDDLAVIVEHEAQAVGQGTLRQADAGCFEEGQYCPRLRLVCGGWVDHRCKQRRCKPQNRNDPREPPHRRKH